MNVPGAWLTLELRDRDGTVKARRRAHNAVLAGGAELIAELFRGGAGGPINRMAVGANPAPEVPPFTTTELAAAAPDTGELTGPRDVEIGPEAFTVTVQPDQRRVVVAARVVLPAGDDTALKGPVAESALLHQAPDGTRRLYNRVTFEPVEKRSEQELSLYWEVGFPFGDPA